MIIRRKITAFIILCFTLILIVTLSDGAQAEATTKPGKPDISITMDDRTATITIGCTEGADGYKVLVNAPGDTKFKKMAFVKKHGKDEIVYLAKNLVNGGYLFKVKAYKVQGGRKIYGKASKTYGVSIGEQYTDYYAYEDSYINDPKPDEVVYESNGIWYDTEGNDVTDKIRWEEVYFVDAFSVTFDNTTAIDEVEKRRTIEKKGKWEESYWYWGPVTREDIRGLIDEGRIKKDEATYEIYNNACREPFKIDDIQALDKLGIEAMSYNNGMWVGFDGKGIIETRRETRIVSSAEPWKGYW